jgi:hypothetical protein
LPNSSKRRDRLVGLFAAGVVLLNPPVIDLFSGSTLFGWPALYVYAFGAWALIILGLAVVLEKRPAPPRGGERGGPR